jgi:EAL domain-containing protein (putative c-di-GMP-specific phosphodiesterase class I)
VEDNELLQELGCDLLQGFLLGAPMSAEKLRASFADASMDRVHAL